MDVINEDDGWLRLNGTFEQFLKDFFRILKELGRRDVEGRYLMFGLELAEDAKAE